MSSAKNKRKTVFIDRGISRKRNLRREINKATKKVEKLLDRNKRGLKRTPMKVEKVLDDGKTKQVNVLRFQGMKDGSKRHLALRDHIKNLKSHLKTLETGTITNGTDQ